MKKRLISILLIVLFISYNSCAFSQAQQLGSSQGGIQSVIIPEAYGSIRDSYFTSTSKGVVVLVQDLHCNYDAQISIYNIINELMDKYSLKLVTIEGSIGRLYEKGFFQKKYEDYVKDEVSRYFIRLGDIGGATYAYAMSNGKFSYWGVDDPKMYDENVQAYRAAIKYAPQTKKYYENIKTIAERIKQKVYSPELKELDSKISAYKKEDIDFAKYISYLNTLAAKLKVDTAAHPNFKGLLSVLEQESRINFKEVDEQRSGYIEKLGKELDKEALSRLYDKSLYFKTARISAFEFYSYLKQVSDSGGVTPVSKYPQLALYIDYLKSYSLIDNIKLFKETDAIEKALKEKLFTNDSQKRADLLSHNIDILNDLFNLRLTKTTLQYYRDHRKELSTGYMINLISDLAQKNNVQYTLDPVFRQIDAALPDLEKFYKLAEERDGLLIYNTIDKMEQERANMCVLVAGGFHTEGITQLLREKDFSYVVITPKIEKLEENNPYKRVLLGEKSVFDLYYENELKNRKT